MRGKKVLIEKSFLDEFSKCFRDYCSQLELSLKHEKNIDVSLLEAIIDLQRSWESVYSPDLKDMKKILRDAYSKYVVAKKEGRVTDAERYLDIYLKLKESLNDI